MTDHQRAPANMPSTTPGLPWRQLIPGAFIPITIFYAFYRFGQPLTGALLAIGWSIGFLVIKYWKSKKVDLFPFFAIPIILIELIGTLITKNPDFYLAGPAIDSVLWGLLFLSSLLLTRPLIQIFAEMVSPILGSKEFLAHFNMPVKLYRSAWKILTLIWGIISLLKAIILILSQLKLPLEAFIIVRTAAGLPVLIVMLFFSFRFPGWYWKRLTYKNFAKSTALVMIPINYYL